MKENLIIEKLTDFNTCRKLKSILSLPSSHPVTVVEEDDGSVNATNNKWLDIIPSLPLKFFIHGWKDYGSNNWVEQLQDGKDENPLKILFLI